MATEGQRKDRVGIDHDLAAMLHEASARYWLARGELTRADEERARARRDLERAERERERYWRQLEHERTGMS